MPDDAFTDLETLQLSPFSRIQALDFFGLLAVSSVFKKKKVPVFVGAVIRRHDSRLREHSV